ncbi:unnamed protein product [Allacma fusca]|uniref:ditrans,polycis-polyprenyl diphosphate synthase [(2E,6E)-farnesyldiphosphate specific] n=1 Tax=Allacma fusca TaxID=39272 RepID=A0A8J2PT44_9HEXA|nr:unnamed protein product [Allacma fusca]
MVTASVKAYANEVLIIVCHLLWVLLHLVYRMQLDVGEKIQGTWRHVVRRLSSCFPLYSYYGELAQLTQATAKLSKVPSHIAFSVIENLGQCDEKKDQDLIDFQLLARVISWAWVARIPVVSLYDYNGRIKRSYRELGCYVQEELIQNFWALKKFGRANEPPCIKFHNIPKSNGYSNGVGSNGVKLSASPLHIVVFCHEDGKPDIIRAAKRLYLEQLQLSQADSTSGDPVQDDDLNEELPSKSINESKLDLILNKNYSAWSSSAGVSSEPDILVILGNIRSTLGFLPWHIRLTEIHWLPKLDIVETRDLLAVLQKYSGCQQRFGT